MPESIPEIKLAAEPYLSRADSPTFKKENVTHEIMQKQDILQNQPKKNITQDVIQEPKKSNVFERKQF